MTVRYRRTSEHSDSLAKSRNLARTIMGRQPQRPARPYGRTPGDRPRVRPVLLLKSTSSCSTRSKP
eukprot:9595-Hanusia_phi.AAC.2